MSPPAAHRNREPGLRGWIVSCSRGILSTAAHSTRGRCGHVIDQSYRAAESVILNIAEAYPMPGADRARRFRIAGAEAAECHAGLDLLEIRGELKGPALSELRALLDRTRAMLWRLGPAVR